MSDSGIPIVTAEARRLWRAKFQLPALLGEGAAPIVIALLDALDAAERREEVDRLTDRAASSSTGFDHEPIEALIARSSIGQGLANIRDRGIDAELADLDAEAAQLATHDDAERIARWIDLRAAHRRGTIMIENAQQYELTKHWARRFREDAVKLRETPEIDGNDPAIHQILIDAAESEADILEAQIAEYEARQASPRPG